MTTRELTELVPADGVGRVFAAVAAVLAEAGRVEVDGFGSFELVRRRPRAARNPRTGERIDVPARTVVRFKPARELRDRSAARE